MEELCPDALLLNYTNPMSILTWALYKACPEMRAVGLCHSVPYTAREISSYIGVPHEDLLYDVRRHQPHRLDDPPGGTTARTPTLACSRRWRTPEVYDRDRVRFELMRRFGYFVTESSEHNAEYTPYFLRDDGLIEMFDVPVDEYIRRSEENLMEYAETRRKLLAGEVLPAGAQRRVRLAHHPLPSHRRAARGLRQRRNTGPHYEPP